MIYEPFALLTILLLPVFAFLAGALLLSVIDVVRKHAAPDDFAGPQIRNGHHA